MLASMYFINLILKSCSQSYQRFCSSNSCGDSLRVSIFTAMDLEKTNCVYKYIYKYNNRKLDSIKSYKYFSNNIQPHSPTWPSPWRLSLPSNNIKNKNTSSCPLNDFSCISMLAHLQHVSNTPFLFTLKVYSFYTTYRSKNIIGIIQGSNIN